MREAGLASGIPVLGELQSIDVTAAVWRNRIRRGGGGNPRVECRYSTVECRTGKVSEKTRYASTQRALPVKADSDEDQARVQITHPCNCDCARLGARRSAASAQLKTRLGVAPLPHRTKSGRASGKR